MRDTQRDNFVKESANLYRYNSPSLLPSAGCEALPSSEPWCLVFFSGEELLLAAAACLQDGLVQWTTEALPSYL